MNEQNVTSLVVKKDNFIEKIKDFFKLFLSYIGLNDRYEKEDNIYVNNFENNDIENNYTEEDYKKELKEILLKIQDRYEKGTIKEENLNNEQKEELKQLYIEQINNLKESIEKNKQIIIKLKEKINILNKNK